MSTTISYKGGTLTTVDNQTKVLETAGTWLEDDLTVTDESSGDGEVLIVDTPDSHGGTIREITTTGSVQLEGAKAVTPLVGVQQTISPNQGYSGFSSVELYSMPRTLTNSWDFTKSLVDSVGGLTATLGNGAIRDSNGITISAQTEYVSLPVGYAKNKCYEMDITSLSKNYSSGHGRILMMSGTEGFIQHNGSQWAFYGSPGSSGVWDDSGSSTAGIFDRKTLTMTTEIVFNRNSGTGVVSERIVPKYYIDGTLWFTPGIGRAASSSMMIGSSSGASYITMVITGFRVYDGYTIGGGNS